MFALDRKRRSSATGSAISQAKKTPSLNPLSIRLARSTNARAAASDQRVRWSEKRRQQQPLSLRCERTSAAAPGGWVPALPMPRCKTPVVSSWRSASVTTYRACGSTQTTIKECVSYLMLTARVLFGDFYFQFAISRRRENSLSLEIDPI
jgi:hypothetical protein